VILGDGPPPDPARGRRSAARARGVRPPSHHFGRPRLARVPRRGVPGDHRRLCREPDRPQRARERHALGGQRDHLAPRPLGDPDGDEPLVLELVQDAEVELTYRKRGYNGRRASDTFTCRLAAVWDEKARRYHLYLTNISSEQLSAEEVAQLYGMRWEIELTFKELTGVYKIGLASPAFTDGSWAVPDVLPTAPAASQPYA